MPIINLVNGQASTHLSADAYFDWENPTVNQVTVTGCSGFCTQSSYTVPARTASGPGLTQAQVNSNPTNWGFEEDPASTWNPGGVNPGKPHVQNPTQKAAA